MRGRATFTDDPARQCQGKTKFGSKKAGKRALTRARQMPGRGSIDVYRCPHCSFWHFGHKAGTKTAPAGQTETRYTEGNEATTGGGEVENGT